MNNPTHQPAHLTDEVVKRARNTFIIGLSIAAIMTGLIVSELSNWDKASYFSLIADGLMLIAGLSAAWFSRRGWSTGGSWLMLGCVYLAILFLNVNVQGVSWLSAIAVIVISTGIATATLSAKWGRRAIVSSFVVAVLIILIDQFWPGQRVLVGNYLIYNIATGLLVVIYIVILVRQFVTYSLRTKLMASLVIVGLLSIIINGVIGYNFNQKYLTDAAQQRLLGTASQTAVILDNFIKTNLDIIRVEAGLPIMERYLSLSPELRAEAVQTELANTLTALYLKDQAFIISYGLLDKSGRVVAETHTPDIGSDQSDRKHFQEPVTTGRPYASSVEFSGSNGLPTLYFTAPVRNDRGEIIGVLRARYDAAVLQKIVSDNNGQAGPESFGMLLDENHIRLAQGNMPEQLYKPLDPLDPTQVQTAVNSLKTQPWQVVFFQPREAFLAPARSQGQVMTTITMLIVLLTIGGAWGLGRYLTQPIIRLTDVARRVTASDLTAQAVVESHDEVGQLAQAFNEMTKQLRASIGSLEDEVRERTADLALSLAVGERAASIRNLDELLPTITDFIGEQFNFYTQIYMVDDLGKNLILRTGIGDVGEELLARRHTLPVGAGSIVGKVAAEGQSIVVPDTQSSDIHKPNPLLPKTRSELAIPLITEGRVIGVLDMQANEANTFTEENLTVFEAMATQLAIAIDGAQQWALAQEAQQKAEEAVRHLIRQNWAERLTTRQGNVGFAYNLSAIVPLAAGGAQVENGGTKLVAPVVVQNESIGQLAVEMPAQRALSTDEQNLLAAVAQQLAQKVETLRLFEETQQRATREQLARQIADKVRASRDIESALKTAAEELSKALGAARTIVDLQVTPKDDQTG